MDSRSLKSSIALLFLLFSVAVPLLSATGLGDRTPLERVIRGWTPLKEINDPYVKEIAGFAVGEYNEKSGSSLKMEVVKRGYSHSGAADFIFRLILKASDGKASGDYEAFVWDHLSRHYRGLASFKHVKQ